MGASVGEEPLGKWRRRPVPRRRPAAAAPLPTYPAGEAGSSQPLALQVTCPRAHLLEMLFSTRPPADRCCTSCPPLALSGRRACQESCQERVSGPGAVRCTPLAFLASEYLSRSHRWGGGRDPEFIPEPTHPSCHRLAVMIRLQPPFLACFCPVGVLSLSPGLCQAGIPRWGSSLFS